MKMFLLFLAIGLVSSEKLDRTYLPPPGAKFSGGSPGDIQTPLEYPKETYSTTLRPHSFNDRAHPDDSQIEVGINRGLPTITEGPGLPTDFHQFAPGSKVVNSFPNTYKVPTTTTSYAFTQTTIHPPVGGLETTVSPFDLVTSGFPTTFLPNLPSTVPEFIVPHLQQGQQVIPGYSQPGNRIIQQSGQTLTPGSNLQYSDSTSPTILPISQTTIDQNRPSYSPGQFNQYQQVHKPGSNILGSNVQIPGLVTQSPYLQGQKGNQYEGSQYPTTVPSIGQPDNIPSSITTPTLPGTSTIYSDNRDSIQGQFAPSVNIPHRNLIPGQESLTTPGDVIQSGNQLIQRPNQQQYQENIDGKVLQQQYPTQVSNESARPGFTDGNLQNIYTPSTISPTIQTSDYSSNAPSFPTSVLPDGTLLPSTPIYPNINRGIIPTGLVNRPERPQAESDRNAVILNYENTITPDGNFSYSFDTSNGIHADENGTSADGVKAKGGYSYIGDDGKLYSITYSADENGFRPHGDHLPTPPPIPDAIQKVIEQAIRNKEAGITDDGTYDEDKYGHKKYQGMRNRNRPQGSNRNIISGDDIIRPYGNRYVDNGKLSSDRSEGEYIPGDEELESNINGIKVGDIRRPSDNSSRRPINRFPGQRENEDDEVVYEDITDSEGNRHRPTNINSHRRPTIPLSEDNSTKNYEEIYEDMTNSNKKQPIGKVPSRRPSNRKQPIEIYTSINEEDFVDNDRKLPIGSIPFRHPSDRYQESNVEDENKNNIKKYSNQRRPTTKVPFRQPENQYFQISNVDENSDLKQPKQGQYPDFTETTNSKNYNNLYPQENIYKGHLDVPTSSTMRPINEENKYSQADDIVKYQDQMENFDGNSNRSRLPSRVTENGYTDSSERTFDLMTGRPINRRPGSYDRYSKPRDRLQVSTTFAPETTRHEQFEESDVTIPGTPVKGQTATQTILKQRPAYGNKYSTSVSTDEETGYQYLPPQTKFEQGVHKFGPGSQGKIISTEILSKYYKSKDRIAEPFTTPSVTRDDIKNDDNYELQNEEEQYHTPIKTKSEYRPALDQTRQNIRPEFNNKHTTGTDNRNIPTNVSGQPGTQITSTRRPFYYETTIRPQNHRSKARPSQGQNNDYVQKGADKQKSSFRVTPSTTPLPTQNKFYGTTQSATQKPGEHFSFDIGGSTKRPNEQEYNFITTTKLQPGQEQNNYFIQKGADKPKGSFRLTPSTTPLPSQNEFYGTTQSGIQKPGEQFNLDIAGSTKRPNEQKYDFVSTTKMPPRTYYTTSLDEVKKIPQQSYQTTYRPNSKVDEYSITPGFGTTEKSGTRIPGRPNIQYQGQLPSTTYRPPFTFRDETNPEVAVDEFKQIDRQYRPNYPIQGLDLDKPVYQTPDDRMSSEYKPGVGRFERPTTSIQDVQSTTQKIIGENFSGPKQVQKFDPEYGYYY